MDNTSADFTPVGLQRAPGRRSGCSCCSFTLMGLIALPVLVVASLFLFSQI